MKYFDFGLAPNPRRVRMFIAEKELDLEIIEVQIRKGEQFSEAMLALNPQAMVPFLQLDDGTVIGETMAICRYLEAVHPEPNLFGHDALDIGLIEMWCRRVDLEGFGGIAEAFRNGEEKRFVNRSLPGPRDYAQIPALVERGRARAVGFFEDMNAQLDGRQFLATASFSAADICAYNAVEFAARIQLAPHDSLANLIRWRDAVGARPSAASLPPMQA